MLTNTNKSPKTRVLAVEDDPLLLELLVNFLEDMGHEVTAESSSIHGLARIDEAKFDLLVTDIHMPDINGLELARHARNAQPCLPIVFVSGDFTSRDRRPSKSILINKPYTRMQLERGINEALQDRPLKR